MNATDNCEMHVGISATAEAGTVDSPGTDATGNPEVIRLADANGDSGIGSTHRGDITVDPDHDESTTKDTATTGRFAVTEQSTGRQ